MAKIELYKEVNGLTEYQFTQLINYLEREQEQKEQKRQDDLVSEAKRMLKVWGAVNAYSSGCGYKDVSSMFSQLYPKCPPIVIENEVDFIESCLLTLKKSKDEKERLKFKVAEKCYKGFDVVINGSERSERLTYDLIAQDLDISRRTLFNRLNELHSYIVSKLSNFTNF